MKEEVDNYIKKYGDQDTPPPWQVFTIANKPGRGNVHIVQKVFEGSFQVRWLSVAWPHCLVELIPLQSLTFSSIVVQSLRRLLVRYVPK